VAAASRGHARVVDVLLAAAATQLSAKSVGLALDACSKAGHLPVVQQLVQLEQVTQQVTT
jgi:hypothetical protein